MFVNVFKKIVPFVDSVEKFGRTRQTTDDNMTWHEHFACWLTKATDTLKLRNTA
jgi:hypothetical protein